MVADLCILLLQAEDEEALVHEVNTLVLMDQTTGGCSCDMIDEDMAAVVEECNIGEIGWIHVRTRSLHTVWLIGKK